MLFACEDPVLMTYKNWNGNRQVLTRGQFSRVTYGGLSLLRAVEVRTCAEAMLSRKMRNGGMLRYFLKQLKHAGRSMLDTTLGALVCMREGDFYALYLQDTVGDCLTRINAKYTHALALAASQRRAAAMRGKPRQKYIPERIPGELVAASQVERQHKQLVIPWAKAMTLAQEVFKVRGDTKYSALRKVERLYRRSLGHWNNKLAQVTRQGFSLRFVPLDGIFRGDITPTMVYSTKDNKHPLYRRLRRKLKRLAQGNAHRPARIFCTEAYRRAA